MTKLSESEDTGQLEISSLQLDMKTLQSDRESDRKEFVEFCDTVQSNFSNIETNFSAIQANFERLFAAVPLTPAVEPQTQDPAAILNPAAESPGQGSVQMPSPKRPTFQHNPITRPLTAPGNLNSQPIGAGKLYDHTGKEVNLDGTPKVPYHHPHYGLMHNPGHLQQQRIEQAAMANQQAQQVENLDDDSDCGAKRYNNRQRHHQNMELRRLHPVVKPAKLNIPEFDGEDADSWIQTLEQYFDSSRTPLDQRTEVAVTYLKGAAVQWWRGTGFSASTVQ